MRKKNFRTVSLYLWLNDMNSQPKNSQIFIFLSSLSLWTWHYFQRILIWLHILKQILKQVALEGFLKKHKYISSAIVTAKIELFVALVSTFQPLTNFTGYIRGSWIALQATAFHDFKSWSLMRARFLFSYLSKQTFFTSKFSGSYWTPSFISIVI